jgi:hypothetical protein
VNQHHIANKLTVHVLAAVAEHEREAISARTKAAFAAANCHAAQVLPVVDAIRGNGIETLAGIARALNERGVLTARGGTWDATRVRNLLARLVA